MTIATYVKQTDKSIREVAIDFGLAKSTVHDMLSKTLVQLDSELAGEVKNILHQHKYRPNGIKGNIKIEV